MDATIAPPVVGTRLPLAIGTLLPAFAGACASLAVSWPLARTVLSGSFADPDDAMRLVEVRQWLAGQPWFDVTAMRLDPPAGASMHWSRLVDLPNAGLIRLLGTITANPEGWDRVVLPSLLLVALYAGMVRLATVLGGEAARWPALLGTFFCGVTLILFQPGRIGHHAPETAALVWVVALTVASFDAKRATMAAPAGVLVALALAMSLETLPALMLICAALVMAWIWRGASMRGSLVAFGLSLGIATPVLFAATVPPFRWTAPVCDAIGAAHVGVVILFAVGSVVLAWSTPRLHTPARRFMAASALAVILLVFVAVATPACLHGPFAGVDPLVRELWLDKVVESLPLVRFARGREDVAFAMALPMMIGAAGAAWGAWSSGGTRRDGFLVIAALCLLGLALGCWQVRVFTTTAPFAVCGGLYPVARLADQVARRGLPGMRWLAALAILPFTSSGWVLALPESSKPPLATGPNCLAPAALAPLATLPPGRMLAPLQGGSHLLEATPHAVFAAPYHRNNDGNRFALDAFLAEPAKAAFLLAGRGVTYVATCPGLGETAALAGRAPHSLAAALQNGMPPPFLRPIPLAGTPFRLWIVTADPR